MRLDFVHYSCPTEIIYTMFFMSSKDGDFGADPSFSVETNGLEEL